MTTPNRPPLWREMADAYCEATDSVARDMATIAIGNAAEIRALRDWLVPEGLLTADETDIRDLLTIEADRAERGDA
jgi:hypothetical protein